MSESGIFNAPARHALSREQTLNWLQLIRSENVGPITFRSLINRFGSAQAALKALPALARKGGRTITVAARASVEQEWAQIEAMGARLAAPCDADYPHLLRFIDAMPPLLTVWGRARAEKVVALVGSRNASAAGRRLTRDIAGALGEAGYMIVSGLARGIDAAAHEASLYTGTLAVLAGGLQRVYPAEHEELLQKIIKTGAAFSEMPLNWQATARDFPRRNRLVSGMALATVVVEAAERSGSLITARLATEQGREVFAVPGSPLDPRASGTNRLIKEGAGMVTSANDILDALDHLPKTAVFQHAGPVLSEKENLFNFENSQPDPDPVSEDRREMILRALGPAPIAVDTLIRETGSPAAEVQTILLELELAGRLERQGGQRVALVTG